MATLTPKEIAVRFGSDARTVRKFIRSEGNRVGKGNRHAIEAKSLKSMQKRFDAWIAAKATKDAIDAVEEDQGMSEDDARFLVNLLIGA